MSTDALNIGDSHRSMSTDTFHIGDNQNLTNAFTNHIDLDMQVFAPDDNVWSGHLKGESTHPSHNERWEISSSPTSSVSSSKIELANILNDNDSGVGGSNPLGPTPISEQNNSRISLHDAAYLETALDNPSWLQNRGAYSAPSSPALQRNLDNSASKTSPKNLNMRSQLSMEDLNYNRQWVHKSNYTDNSQWNDRKITPPTLNHKLGDSPENRDSAVSSPRSTLDRGVSSPRLPLERKTKAGTQEIEPSLTTNTKPWSAERFQDVHTVADLLSQLSLDKYSAKLQVSQTYYITIFSKWLFGR